MAMIGSISGHQIRRWEPNLFASGGYAYDAERVSNFLYNDFRSGVVDTLKVSGVLKSAGAPPADSLRMQNKPFANTTSTTPFVSDSGSATIWWGDGKSETVAEGSQATHTYDAAIVTNVDFVADEVRWTQINPNSFWSNVIQWGNTSSPVILFNIQGVASIPSTVPTNLTGNFWTNGGFYNTGVVSVDPAYLSLGVNSDIQGLFWLASIDQDFGGLDLSSVTSINNMFKDSGMSDANIAATLVGWDIPATNTGVSASNLFGSNKTLSESTYPNAKTAYDNLVAPVSSGGKGWTITGITWVA